MQKPNFNNVSCLVKGISVFQTDEETRWLLYLYFPLFYEKKYLKKLVTTASTISIFFNT